jgi:hypothetical protein
VADSLHSILSVYKVATLASMVSFNGLSPYYQKGKDAYLQALVELFNDPMHIQLTYQKLLPAEREVVDELLLHDGQMTTYSLSRHLSERKFIDPSGNNKPIFRNGQLDVHQRNPRNLEVNLARLQAFGLVFGVPVRNAYGQEVPVDFNLVQEYFIPEDIRVHLPPPPSTAPWKPQNIAAPDRILEGSARTFQRDLYFYWSFARSNPIQLTAKGLVLKRHLTALNDTMLVREAIGTGQAENDFPRMIFIRSLLAGLKVLNILPNRIDAQPDPNFFSQKPIDRIKDCFNQYVNGKIYNELLTCPNAIPESAGEPRSTTPEPVIKARKEVLKCMRTVVNWVRIDQLIHHIRQDHYEFLFKRFYRGEEHRTYYSYGYATHPYTPYTNPLHWDFSGITSDSDGWEKVESYFIRTIILQPLAWMGLVDLGFSRPNLTQPDMFCLTPVGAWLLAGGSPPEINLSGGRVILQPNFQITAFDPISDDVLLNLERFAERISAERAVELRLTQSSVYQGQMEGWDNLRIQDYLEQVTGVAVPENIKRTLKDWQLQHERITVYPRVSLLHAARSEDLDQLLEFQQIKNLLDIRPTPSLALIKERKTIPKLIQGLVEEAWLPVVTPGENEPQAKIVDVSDEGTLRFLISNPDLYLHGYLSRFADLISGTEYQLSAASIQRAVRNGMTAPQIISELERVSIAGIPTHLEKRILAWSGHYGEAILEETVLLKVQSAAILQELIEDPEIGPLLQPVDTSNTQETAHVRPEDLPRLRQLLTEKGIKQV